MDPLSILKGPIGGVLGKVGELVDRLTTSDEERNKARAELLQIERQATQDLLLADAEFVRAQAQVITAEAGSQSWLARSWRPLTMLTFTFCIFYNYMASPLFGAPRVELPTDLWDVIKLGLTGYVVGRSAEKIAPSIAEAIRKK